MTGHEKSTGIDDLASWVQAYESARGHEKGWRETAERIKGEITAVLAEADADVGTVAGQPVVRHTRVEQHRLDTKKLRADYPDLAEAYTAPQVTRRFTVVDRD